MELQDAKSGDRFNSSSIDTRILVEHLLDQLSPALRAALVLRELEGMEYADVARTLGVPIGTVRSRLNAARSQFKDLWFAALGEENDHG
jgi:RNA polymerase sigma-70 factor (ECF subfamily)